MSKNRRHNLLIVLCDYLEKVLHVCFQKSKHNTTMSTNKMTNTLNTSYGQIWNTSDLIYEDTNWFCSSNVEYKSLHMSHTIQIIYYVEKVDHTGWCTDLDGDGWYPEYYFCYSNRFITNHKPSIESLNYRSEGCTSDGSGYCENFYTSFTALAYRHVIDSMIDVCTIEYMNAYIAQVQRILSLHFPYGVDGIITLYFNSWTLI